MNITANISLATLGNFARHGWLRPKQEQQAAFAAAVSYTHLRAHETVLDLVCRLLLEKKNNSYSPASILS